MRTYVEPLAHDKGVIAALESIPPTGDDPPRPHPVGFARAPTGALQAVLDGTGADYLVLHPLPGSTLDGPSGDPYADADLSYQITCVGRTATGVRWLVNQLEPALRTLQIPGRGVKRISMEDLGAVRPDEDTRPPTFIATPRCLIRTGPTPT